MVGIPNEPFRIVVIVFVYDSWIRIGWMPSCPLVCNKLHFRVFGMNSIRHEFPAFSIGLHPVLVADFKVFKVEGRRMAVLCANTAPNRSDRAICIFKGIQSVLNPLSHL